MTKCLLPWTRMYVGSTWFMCCCSGAQESLCRAVGFGDVKRVMGENGGRFLSGLWNSAYYRQLRSTMTEKGAEASCFHGEEVGCSPVIQTWRIGRLQEIHEQNIESAVKSYKRGEVEVSHYPLQLFLILGLQCNYNCVMCNQRSRRRRGELEELQVEYFLDEMREFFRHCPSVSIQGGETTLIPSYDLIVDAARSNHVAEFEVITNGSTLRSKIIPNLDVINALQISIDATNEQDYGAIRGGNWSHLMEGLKLLVDNRPPNFRFQFRNVVMSTNAEKLPAMVELAADFGADVIFEEVEWIDKDIDLSPLMLDQDTIETVDRSLDEAIERANQLGVYTMYSMRSLNRYGHTNV